MTFASITSPPSTRIAALDTARGFAILSVVASHALLMPEQIGSWIYEFYVPLFFILAGYLARPGHVCSRLTGMVRSYFVTCGALFAIWAVLYPLRGEQLSLLPRAVLSILYGRFYDPALPFLTTCCWTGQLWFLTLLCTATLLFYLLRRLTDAHPACLAGVLIMLLAAAQLLRQLPFLLPWCVDTAPLGAAYLLAGQWLARQDFARRPLHGKMPLLLAFCLLIYLALHDTYDLNLRLYGRFEDLRGPAAFFLAGTSGSILCLALCVAVAQLPVLGSILRRAGQHSMPIFCWHIFWLWFMDSVRIRLPAVFSGSPAGQLLYAALALVAVPLLCVGTVALGQRFCRQVRQFLLYRSAG